MKLRTKLIILFTAMAVVPMVFVESLNASFTSIVGVVSVLVVMLVALFVAESISNPVRRLTEAAQDISQGDLDKKIEHINTKDEIGLLGSAFSSMVAKLGLRTRSLESAKAKSESLVRDLDRRIIELENARRAMTNLLEDVEEEQGELSKANAKDEALLENIGDGMIVVDNTGKITVINKAAINLLGVRRDEALGRQYVDVFRAIDANGTDIPPAKRPISFALISGQKYTTPVLTSPTTSTGKPAPKPISSTIYYMSKSGVTFPVAATVTPVIVDGEVIGAIDIFRDISKENEIEKLRLDFLTLASHQLRTPLSGVKWLIETIQRGVAGEMNEKQKEYLNQIYKANERMIALVYDMLDVLKLESGLASNKKDAVTIPKLFEELTFAMEPVAKEKGIVLVSSTSGSTPLSLETDLTLLRTCLSSLISNAIAYSQKGSEVTLGAREEAGAITLFVKDSGIGIPKDEQKRIFERFYRASNAKELIPEGTGLGLYRVSLLAEKIGAKISFESEENKGATFYIKFPKQSA